TGGLLDYLRPRRLCLAPSPADGADLLQAAKGLWGSRGLAALQTPREVQRPRRREMARRPVRRFLARAAPGRADHLPRHVRLGFIPMPVPTGPRSLAHVAEHARMACGRPDPDRGRCFVAGAAAGGSRDVGPVAAGGRAPGLASLFAAEA